MCGLFFWLLFLICVHTTKQCVCVLLLQYFSECIERGFSHSISVFYNSHSLTFIRTYVTSFSMEWQVFNTAFSNSAFNAANNNQLLILHLLILYYISYSLYRSNIEGLQTKVTVVKSQMQHNLDAAMRRGDELEHLQTQAGQWPHPLSLTVNNTCNVINNN